jgi:hypothetical protein
MTTPLLNDFSEKYASSGWKVAKAGLAAYISGRFFLLPYIQFQELAPNSFGSPVYASLPSALSRFASLGNTLWLWLIRQPKEVDTLQLLNIIISYF